MLRTRLAPLVPLSFIALLAACANAPQQQKPEQAQLSKPAREQSAAVESKQSAQPIHWLSSKATRGDGHASRQPLSWEHEVGSTQPMPTLADSILTRAEELVGTPYRTGGSSLKGFDCSGFVNYVFREEAGIQLPRSTRQIINLDVPVISKNDLQPGDILLFNHNGRGRVSHAAIYMGEGKFIHSSSHRSGGVRVDSLEDHYWKVSFLEGKRILR
ncbi:peptidoglycan endopeptidase [Pseudomonas sp. LTJR-52]|nr:C40 family peptidase [Pseudomonas sp. LTJR-52]AYN94282.1 peptidoglycan endopeptidase [Pseudomonas sp. LTJR-52]